MFGWLKRSVPPEFCLRPLTDGQYSLDHWTPGIGYLSIDIVKNKAEAEIAIKNLGRETMYWYGK